MRISTAQIYNIATLGMGQAQAAVTKTQEQMATGKRVLSPADDPVAATNILQLNQELARTEQYKKNIDVADNALNLEETSLQTIVDLVQRMREIAVSAGNTAVFTAADYKALAAEVDTRISELVNLQNTRNSSGQYIFAGYQGATKPFEGDGGGNFSYHGDEGQLRLQASASVTVAVSDSGKKLFVDIPSGHTTFNTSANQANKSLPAAMISVGQVVDQATFDALSPEDLVVTFTKAGSTGVNYTVSEKSSGKQLVANAPYVAGKDIETAGIKFQVLGNPFPGDAAIPAALPFGSLGGLAASSSVKITVGGKTEEFDLVAPISAAPAPTALAELVSAFNTGAAVPPALPTGNAAKLASLGISVDNSGFHSATGLNITVADGTASTQGVLGLPSGTTSINMPFQFGGAYDFSLTPQNFTLSVNGKTETLRLNQNVTNATDLASAFNSPNNASQLARLGLTVTADGISSKANAPITLKGGSTFLDSVTGLTTQGAGSQSSQGVLAVPGDTFFIESTNKQSLLTTLARFSDALKNVADNPASKAKVGEMAGKTLTNLDNAITNIVAAQGEVGSRLNTLESSKDLNLDVTLFSKQVLASLQDLDYAEASIKLSMQSFVLSASQQSFVKVSQLSLFSYL